MSGKVLATAGADSTSQLQMKTGTDSTMRSEMATVPTSGEAQLPKITLNAMSKKELKEFIPRLLKIVTGREDVWHSRRSAKPDWWPAGVDWAMSKAEWLSKSHWTENLRSIVKSCYRHLGKEDLLYDLKGIDINPLCKQLVNTGSPVRPQSYPSSPYKQYNNSPVKPQSYPPSPLKLPSGLYLPFSAEVFICYFCEAEFYNKEEMRAHQISCREGPPDLPRCASLSPNPRTHNDPPAISPNPYLSPEQIRLPLDKFIDYLDLLPLKKAAKLKRTRNSMEVTCKDLGDLGPQSPPLSPVTPTTPKSLISQMSREDSTSSRKRLSYSLSMEHGDCVSIESASESSDSSDDEGFEERTSAKPKDLNLLSIDLTSLLGERIKKFVHVESPVQVLGNSESYCKTPVKNSFLEKLRKKPPAYPVTYKPRRIANLHKQNHLYRFSRKEQKDFYEYVNTGLNRESRDQLKKMKKLRVRLTQLTQKKMLKWVPRRVLQKQLKCQLPEDRNKSARKFVPVYASYPQGPMLLSKNVDKILGLKKKSVIRVSDRLQNPLSVGNYISEEMEADLSKLKLTLYRSLLYEVEEYKAGRISDLTIEKDKNSVKLLEETKSRTPGKKPEKASPPKSYVPIAERVFETEDKESLNKPKGEMSVLRALLRKNKEDDIRPVGNQPHASFMSAPKAPVATSKTRSPGLDGLSKSLKADLMKDFRINRDSSENSFVSTSCLSSPGSAVSSDESFMSPNIGGIKSANRTPVFDDSVSIISMPESSDGDSPNLNCCTGCTNRAERLEKKPSDGKDITKFLEPLSVKVDNDFTDFAKTKPDLKVDISYGVPSPVPSMTESPLPLTPIKTTIDPKEFIEKVIEDDFETTRRYTRSKGNVSLPTFDELTDILKQAEVKMNKEPKVVKSVSEPDKIRGTLPLKENKLSKSRSEKVVQISEQPLNNNSPLIVKGVDSPRSSPKKGMKNSYSNESNTRISKHQGGKEAVHKKENAQNQEGGMSTPKVESALKNALNGNYWAAADSPRMKHNVQKQEEGTRSSKVDGVLKHELNGNYWAAAKSRRKVSQDEDSPLRSQTSTPLSDKVMQVIPIKKSVSLTPSPSPKKAEIAELKKSSTETPKSSPKKKVGYVEFKVAFAETPKSSPRKIEEGINLKRSFIETPKSSPRKTGGQGDSKESSNSKSLSQETDKSSGKAVVQLRSSTLLTPTKMTISTRSVSVDSNGTIDDNQYSLRSGNFIIDSPRCSPREIASSPRCMSDNGEKNAPNVHSAKKETQLLLESGYISDGSPRKPNSVHDVSRKIDFEVSASFKAGHAQSPNRPKRLLSSPAEAPKPAKLRKVSSDVGLKIKD